MVPDSLLPSATLGLPFLPEGHRDRDQSVIFSFAHLFLPRNLWPSRPHTVPGEFSVKASAITSRQIAA